MENKINPYQSPVNELFLRLNELNGLLFHIVSYLNNYRKQFKEALAKNNIDSSGLLIGSALVVRDLTEFPADGWAIHYPTGSFYSQDEKYFQRIDELINRESAWTVSQGFEAFETFLKDVYAYFLLLNPYKADGKRLEKLDIELKKLKLMPTEFGYWEQLVRRLNICNSDLFKIFRVLTVDLGKYETKNNRALNLAEWYEMAEEVRHATIHSNMTIKRVRMSSWPNTRNKVLEKYFPGIYTDNGSYILRIDYKRANQNLALFAEYAFVIFKSMSLLNNYNFDALTRPQ